jgi:hypothetical protein
VHTAPFDASGEEVGLCFLGWLREELELLPAIMTSLMSIASLITCEGAANALSHEGCRHFEVFDRSDEDFDRGIFQVEDEVLKRYVGVLYDRMWGPHGYDTVWERSDRAMEKVWVFLICIHIWCCFGRWRMMKRSMTLEAWAARSPWRKMRGRGLGSDWHRLLVLARTLWRPRAPAGEDTSAAAVPAAEDPAAPAAPSQVAG